jgi:hypothetical protein
MYFQYVFFNKKSYNKSKGLYIYLIKEIILKNTY